MGAVAAIILLFICLIGSRNETVYKVIIALMYLIGIGLFIAGCVTGFGYGIGGGILIILIAYFLTYVVSGCRVSIFTLFDYFRDGDNTREFYPASKKAVENRREHLEEIKKQSEERTEIGAPPSRQFLQQFHGWDIPETVEEFGEKICQAYAKRRRYPDCLNDVTNWRDSAKKTAKILMKDCSSEFYDTTVHYKRECDWYIILHQLGIQQYKKRICKKIEYSERAFYFSLPKTSLEFVKEYAYMKKDAKLCEKYKYTCQRIIWNEDSPFYADSPYYEERPYYETREQLFEACIQWGKEKEREEGELWAKKYREEQDKKLRQQIDSFK